MFTSRMSAPIEGKYVAGRPSGDAAGAIVAVKELEFNAVRETQFNNPADIASFNGGVDDSDEVKAIGMSWSGPPTTFYEGVYN